MELVGEKKQKDQAKIQFESKVRTSNQDLKKSGQNQTQSRFKDLLEEDSALVDKFCTKEGSLN